MASWSSPSAAAAASASSGARFGLLPGRAQRQPVPSPSLPRGAPNPRLVLSRGPGFLTPTGSASPSSSSRCRAVAAEVEGLNIANDVTQVLFDARLSLVHGLFIRFPNIDMLQY